MSALSTTAKRALKRIEAIPSDPDELLDDAIGADDVARSRGQRIIVDIPLGNIDRHPKNRIVEETDPDVISLANSIAEHGQLEPMRVRDLGNGRYQLISGERRSKALLQAGFAFAKCIVVSCDEATALSEVAVANAERKDLDPIERAELMVELMKPVKDGGSGLTREQAGRIFGLESESGCKNALRLLRLPAGIRELVKSGEIPERVARKLVPFADVKPIIAAIEKEIVASNKSGHLDELLAQILEPEAYYLRDLIDEHLRPYDLGPSRWYEYPVNRQPRLFEADAAIETQLELITLPTSDHVHGKIVVEQKRWARNVKLWDKLQAPHIQAIKEGKSKKESKSSKSTAKPKKLTPAEEAAELKRKQKENDRKLEQFTRDWKSRLLRAHLASLSSNSDLVALTIGIVTSRSSFNGMAGLMTMAEAAFVEIGIRLKLDGFDRSGGVFAKASKLVKGRSQDLLAAYWRLILWPVSTLVGDAEPHDCISPAGVLPDRIGYIDRAYLDTIAELGGVSVETAWKAGAVDGSDERRLLAVWLTRHTSDQLRKLIGTWKIDPKSTPANAKRSELVDLVLRSHKAGRPLSLPAMLADKKPSRKGAK